MSAAEGSAATRSRLSSSLTRKRRVEAGLDPRVRFDARELRQRRSHLLDAGDEVAGLLGLQAPRLSREPGPRDAERLLGHELRQRRLAEPRPRDRRDLDRGVAPPLLPCPVGRDAEREDDRERVGVLEDRGVAEVEDRLGDGVRGEEGPERLAVARPHPLVRDDVGQLSARRQEPRALLDEVGVEVGRAVVDVERLQEVRLEVREPLGPDVGRVPEHAVEPTAPERVGSGLAVAAGVTTKDLGERRVPVEGAGARLGRERVEDPAPSCRRARAGRRANRPCGWSGRGWRAAGRSGPS